MKNDTDSYHSLQGFDHLFAFTASNRRHSRCRFVVVRLGCVRICVRFGNMYVY